jgi:hypothetical protein
MFHFLLSLALWYIVIGLFFAAATFLGTQNSNSGVDEESRIYVALLAILIWPYAIYRFIDDNNYENRRRKK